MSAYYLRVSFDEARLKGQPISKKAVLSSPLLGPCSFLKVAERCRVSSAQSVAAHKKYVSARIEGHTNTKEKHFFQLDVQSTNQQGRLESPKLHGFWAETVF